MIRQVTKGAALIDLFHCCALFASKIATGAIEAKMMDSRAYAAILPEIFKGTFENAYTIFG